MYNLTNQHDEPKDNFLTYQTMVKAKSNDNAKPQLM